MSLLSIAKKGLTSETINPMDYRGLQTTGSGWFFGAGGDIGDVYFTYSSLNDALKAYLTCPPVAAIINRKVRAHLNGRVWLTNTSGKAKGKEAAGSDAARLRKLMAKPNPLQTWDDFDGMVKAFANLFGWCPVLALKPVGFDASHATSLWVIPPFLLEVKESDKLFYSKDWKPFEYIKLAYKGQTADLPVDDVYIIRGGQAGFTSLALPESPIKSLKDPVQNCVGAYASRKTLIYQRGALGILSNMGKDQGFTSPMEPGEKEEVQQEFLRYGAMPGQFRIIITNAALQWQQMGYSTKDLMLFEEVEASVRALCDGLGYQHRLLSENGSNSLGGSDLKWFQRQLYEESIQPEAHHIYSQYAQMFNLASYGLQLEKDFTHLAALQEDAVQMATARKNRNQAYEVEFFMNACTLNEMRIANGDDPISEDWGNKYYHELLKLGFVFGKPGAAKAPASDQQDGQNNTDQNSSNGN